MKIVNLYKDTFSKEHWSVDSHEAMLEILGGRFSQEIAYLRSLDKESYSKEKLKLPAITWSGTFSDRIDKGLLEYSNLICLDIDNIESDVVDSLKSQLATDEYVKYCFTSPSNRGIKIIVEVNTGKEHHKAAFLHLQKVFEDKYFFSVDESGKNLSRLCFVSADERAIIRENNTIFEVDTKFGVIDTPQVNKEKYSNYTDISDVGNIFRVCVKWVEMTKQYVAGKRNVYIHALACALNRVGVAMDEAEYLIGQDYDLDHQEIHMACKSAYFHNQAEHGTVKVKDAGVGEFKAPAYVANYTDDVVKNDLMAITAMLYHHKVDKKEIMRLVGKVALYYKKEGYIDLDRKSLVDLMGESVKVLQDNIKKDSSLSSMAYETAEDMGIDLVDLDMIEGVIPTNVPEFDMALRGGLMPGNFYGLIGVGGTFKSVFSEYLAYMSAMNDIPVLYLNGEMGKMQFYERLGLMAMNLNIYNEIAQGRLSKENVGSFIEQMAAITKRNIFIVNGNGFGEQNIISTIENIESTTGKKIRLVIIDGVTQMDSLGREEIPAAIHNTAVCKEIAKKTNTVVVGLMHVSGDSNKLLRDTGTKCRGGIKTTSNMDGYFSTSLLLDPVTNELENNDDMVFRKGMFYLRMVDKRSAAGTMSKIMEVKPNLNLQPLDYDPNQYEVKLERRR